MHQTLHNMPSSNTPVPNMPCAAMSAADARSLEALTKALVSEKQLITDLIAVILRQRAAVGVDDIQGIDDTVFATHRLLLTLGEARRHRRSINRLLGCPEELSVRRLDDVLGVHMTPQLRTARAELCDAAQQLSKEISINRRILREALAQSESYILAMRGLGPFGAQEMPRIYDPSGLATYTTSGSASFSRTV